MLKHCAAERCFNVTVYTLNNNIQKYTEMKQYAAITKVNQELEINQTPPLEIFFQINETKITHYHQDVVNYKGLYV